MTAEHVVHLVHQLEIGGWEPVGMADAAVGLYMAAKAEQNTGRVIMPQSITAAHLGTSHQTISRALRALGEAGIVRSQPGTRGLYWLTVPGMKNSRGATESPPAAEAPRGAPNGRNAVANALRGKLAARFPNGFPSVWEVDRDGFPGDMALATECVAVGLLRLVGADDDGSKLSYAMAT